MVQSSFPCPLPGPRADPRWGRAGSVSPCQSLPQHTLIHVDEGPHLADASVRLELAVGQQPRPARGTRDYHGWLFGGICKGQEPEGEVHAQHVGVVFKGSDQALGKFIH